MNKQDKILDILTERLGRNGTEFNALETEIIQLKARAFSRKKIAFTSAFMFSIAAVLFWQNDYISQLSQENSFLKASIEKQLIVENNYLTPVKFSEWTTYNVANECEGLVTSAGNVHFCNAI